MSRSWPRVASPCGGSNLITSAPIQASSCEQVGPACTWVMSRIRTSFKASMRVSVCFSDLLLLRARVEARDASALGAGGLVDDGVDECGLAGANGLFHRLAQLGRRGCVHPDAAEGLDQLVVARALHEHGRRHV